MEHPVPQFLEVPTKTWKLTCIRTRNFPVASCLTPVLHLQEEVLPLSEVSKASLPRVNLQQSQRPAPHPGQFHLAASPGRQQLPQHTHSGWSLLEEASVQSVLQHKCTERKRDTQHVIQMFKKQNNAVQTKDEAVCNTTEYYPISQHCLCNNIQNRCSPCSCPQQLETALQAGVAQTGKTDPLPKSFLLSRLVTTELMKDMGYTSTRSIKASMAQFNKSCLQWCQFPFLLWGLLKYLNCYHKQNIQKFISPYSWQEGRCLTQTTPLVLLKWKESHLCEHFFLPALDTYLNAE